MRNEKILLLEKDTESRDFVRHFLEDEGFSVIETEDARVALDLASEHKPDLILLDIVMPEIDGLTVFNRLRDHPELHRVPILLISGKTEVIESLEGAKGYLLKPVQLDDLKTSIEKAIRPHRLVELSLNDLTSKTHSIPVTATYLDQHLLPYLHAVSTLQEVLDRIHGYLPHHVIVRRIEYHSPVKISLEGAAEAIQVLTESIVPWRRKHARELADLSITERQAQIESIKAEILERRARASRDRAESKKLVSEASVQTQEAERLRLDNDNLRLSLQRERIRLAIEIISGFQPNISETERIGFVIALLPALDNLSSSSLEPDDGFEE